jgi:hypothetical protein
LCRHRYGRATKLRSGAACFSTKAAGAREEALAFRIFELSCLAETMM